MDPIALDDYETGQSESMIIEVTGTSTRNKGAELMLLAIRKHFGDKSPEIQLAVDLSFGSWKDRSSYGLATKVEIKKRGRSRVALNLMPASFKQSLGIVRDTGIDAVLDASGFAFGDQHPLERSLRFADQVARWSRKGKPVILLPQALGPFEKSGYANAFKRIVAAATLVFARDDESFQHATRACKNTNKLIQAPDFTNLLKPVLPGLSAESKRVCIVPNQRMLEKAEKEQEREQYINLLIGCIQQVQSLGLKPMGVLHGDDDKALFDAINKRLESVIPVKAITDPIEIKRFIGSSHLLIGSRFHALANALSQGVPALATSWSHKYEALFSEYGQSDCILAVDASPEHVRPLIGNLLGKGRANRVEVIRSRASDLEQKTIGMWQEVDGALGINQ